MGSLIIKAVVNELLSKGLDKAKVLLLAGVRWALTNRPLSLWTWCPTQSEQQLSLALCVISAGSLGVLVNVDQVEEQLRSQGHQGVQVRGVSDSGWVQERRQYKPGSCTTIQSCGPTDVARLGFQWVEGKTDQRAEIQSKWYLLSYRYWGTVMPEACRQLNAEAEWKCFLGPIIYPTIKSG